MSESGATSDKKIPSKEEMESMFKTFTHLVNTKNLEELRKAMDQLPVETRKEFIYNFKTDKNLMFQACLSKSTQIVEYFIVECKADVNEVIRIGLETLTALFISIKTNNVELINILLNHGADINWRDLENRSPIVYACYHNKMEAAHALKDHLANINDDTNRILCAENLSYLKRALKLGARVNYKDYNRETILMKAVENGNVGVIKLLLKENADFYLRSHFTGANALDMAHFLKKVDVLDYLEKMSVYALADKVTSYDLCGAQCILIGKDLDKALEFWRVSARLRKEHGAAIGPLVEENPAVDIGFDMEAEEFVSDCISLVKCFKPALKVVCRIVEERNPFLKRSFVLVAYNREFQNSFLTFETLREYCQINSSSLMPIGNGAFIGMAGAVSMCEKQYFENYEDVEETVLFIERMVQLITEEVVPIVQRWPRKEKAFRVYKQLLIFLLRLIDYLIELGCTDNDKLNASIQKIARLYISSYPTSMLLIAIERCFSFKTVSTLVDAGANVNDVNETQKRPLDLIAKQPDHFSDKVKIRQFLINSGAKRRRTLRLMVHIRLDLLGM